LGFGLFVSKEQFNFAQYVVVLQHARTQ